MESIVVFDMEGEWTCLAEIWSDEESSDTLLAAGLLNTMGSFVVSPKLAYQLVKRWYVLNVE